LKEDFPVWQVPSTISIDQLASGVGVVVVEPGVELAETVGEGSSVIEEGSFPVKSEPPPPASITANMITTMTKMI
jgi:hypothetical protein